MKRNILALTLTLFLILTMLPAPVLAEAPTAGTFGSEGSNLTWSLDETGLLTVTGIGSMGQLTAPAQVPWSAQGEKIRQAVISDGVTDLCDYAFFYCANLSAVTLPGTVTGIGCYAFAWCNSLTQLTIPSGVTKIAAGAFADCRTLTGIRFNGSAPAIDGSAFTAVSAEAVYPAAADWSEEACQNYGGALTWAASSQYDVAEYRCGSTYTYPAKDGYVFGGWYTDPEMTQPLGKDAVSGTAYAKFVNEAVLSVKWQVTAGTNADTPSTTVRLVTTVDDLNYSSVGFRFRIGEGKWNTRTSSTVYSQIKSNTAGVVFNYQPTVFHETSRYFLTRTITGVPSAYYDTPWMVVPFWMTLDGTEVTGVTRTFAVSDFYNR